MQSMEDPVIIEAWFRLTESARRGVGGAEEAVRLLAEAWKSPEELRGWLERFVPLRSELSGPEDVSGVDGGMVEDDGCRPTVSLS